MYTRECIGKLMRGVYRSTIYIYIYTHKHYTPYKPLQHQKVVDIQYCCDYVHGIQSDSMSQWFFFLFRRSKYISKILCAKMVINMLENSTHSNNQYLQKNK